MANKRLQAITEKWKDFLDEGRKIGNDKVRKSTAVMLENQHNFLTGRMDETTS